jgi:DNA-binding response OmpR family regulator
MSESSEGRPIGPAHGRHLLLVDDDVHILKSLRIYLEMEHFQVRTASSGKDALAQVAEAVPDLIVLDVMMPEMDGFQVLETLKGDEATRGIPIIMLTAKGQDADVLRGYKQGANSYMTKPVNYDELVDNIQLIFDDEEIEAGSGNP